MNNLDGDEGRGWPPYVGKRQKTFRRAVNMFRWVLIKDHPGVQSAERNLTRSDTEVQERGAPSIFEEVRSNAEAQTAKQ